MKELKHSVRVTKQQARFCGRLGLDVGGLTTGQALAKLHDLIDREFHGRMDLGHPTASHVALAAKFGIGISRATKREADAIVADLLVELNLASIADQGLAPGVAVINSRDRRRAVEVIASISDRGLVYFKGSRGRRACARDLKRVNQTRAG